MAARRSPLHERHLAGGARFADFGGWSLPLEYAGGGVVAEHTAVRTTVGLFDVSHLGKVSVRGTGALEHVNRCLSADLAAVAPGQAQYTLCCNDAGGIVDDLIAYVRSPADLLLVPNAANAASVAAKLAAAAPQGVRVDDEHERWAVLAVQGSRSAQVLDRVGLASELAYLAFTDTDWRGSPVVVCRTGYTGERGYELVVPAEPAGPLWDALLDAVQAAGGRPCGLGARDTLRTEMGYPLHGQDIGPDVTPVQAGLGFAVGWSKPQFWGREALLAERARGPQRQLRGLRAGAPGVPRPHMLVRAAAGREVGHVTSGTYSPTLGAGIALALLDSAVREGDQVEVDVRGRSLPAAVVRPPFVPASPR